MSMNNRRITMKKVENKIFAVKVKKGLDLQNLSPIDDPIKRLRVGDKVIDFKSYKEMYEYLDKIEWGEE